MPIRKSAQTRSLNGAARFRPGWVPWLWVTLPVLAVISFYIYPFITTVYVSFTKTKPMGKIGSFVGLKNFYAVLGDPEFWQSLTNSLIYAVCVVPLMVLLPLLLALLVKSHVPGIGFFRALYYLPAISSLVVISLAWRYLLDQRGPINNMLASWGLDPVPFLSNQWLILFCAMLITLWQGLPYYMILYLSALANVDKSLYEAAGHDVPRRHPDDDRLPQDLYRGLPAGWLRLAHEDPHDVHPRSNRRPDLRVARTGRCRVGVPVPHHLRLHHRFAKPAEEG